MPCLKFDKLLITFRFWLFLFCLFILSPIIGQNLDHGLLLFSEGKLIQAKKELIQYISEHPDELSVQLTLAWIDHWLGFQTQSEFRVKSILEKDPENREAILLLNEIHEMRRPILSISEEFQKDDQPMNRWHTEAGISWYRSNLLNINLELNHLAFRHDSNTAALIFRAGNTFFEPLSRVQISADIGLYTAQESNLLWSIYAERKFLKALSLKAGLDKTPYFYTLSSVQADQAILMLKKDFSLTLNHEDKWIGKAAIENNAFVKNEEVRTQYAWIIAPVIHKSYLKLGAGYAYSHSHSDSLTFVPQADASGEYIPNPDGGLLGVYNPYFSPMNQSVHWLLLSLEIPLSEKVKWKSRFSYGIKAEADNPYLYENVNPTGEPFVDFGYVIQRYTPAELESALIFQFGNELEIRAAYFYQRLFFYTAQGGRIELKYRLGK
jgi:hypothetical protein